MNLISQEVNNKIKIIIEELANPSQVKELLTVLKRDCLFEINFLNIKFIPREVVIKLEEIKDKVSIYTNESILKKYLLNLNFKLNYINSVEEVSTLNLKYIVIKTNEDNIKKTIELISNLPKSYISIFILLEETVKYANYLNNILKKQLENYNIEKVKSDLKIEPNTIYTISSEQHMVLANDFLFLTNSLNKADLQDKEIDLNIKTLSKEYNSSLLLILINNDWTNENLLNFLKKNKTTIIKESQDSCNKTKQLINNNIKTKLDYILNLDEINDYILHSIYKNYYTEEELIKFLEKIHKIYNYDYREYNIEHIRRRVNYFYTNTNSKNFHDFEKIILTNKSVFKELFLNLSINVTTFFRNPEVFKTIKSDILPKLKDLKNIKIWCAGCSSGEEPYSIAIFLNELGLLDKSTIYATDINEIILKIAKNGLYSKKEFSSFLEHYYQASGSESFREYFIDYGNFVELKNKIKDKIIFLKHDLIQDPKIDDFHLILCRNVIIYFNQNLKHTIFKLFNDSLNINSFLILGESEVLDNSANYHTIDKKNKIYTRER